MARIIALLFLLCSTVFCSSTDVARIGLQDVPGKAREIMSYHPSYKHINDELAKRVMSTFCEELDPLKVYFTYDEVSEWVDPSDAMVRSVSQAFRTGEFEVFSQLFVSFQAAVDRRAVLEERLNGCPFPERPSFQTANMKWTENIDALFDRLSHMRAVQIKSAEKMDQNLKQTALERINKRRHSFEQQRIGKDPVEGDRILATFILKALASALDSQTAFFTPAEAKQLLVGMQQRLFGIGVLLRDDMDGFSVIKIVEGGPADREGRLRVGDKIIAVDGDPVLGLDVMDVVEMVRGKAGSKVCLKVLRTDEENGLIASLEIKVSRGEVVVKDQRYGSSVEQIGEDTGAYLKLHSFYQDGQSSSYSDLYDSFQQLQASHAVKGVVLDLRYNPGGLLTQAVSVAGLFLDKGVVVSVKDEQGGIGHIRNVLSKKMWDGPLVVLVNRASASASEIVAQALQDWGRAIIVGDDRSFGKGSFQTFTLNINGTTPPNPQGEYKVTRGRYYTVSGKSPQLVGVKSDIVIPSALQFAQIGEKYSKFPLPEDRIASSYDDTLSDVDGFQKVLLSRVYACSRQEKTNEWTRFLVEARRRSESRMNNNKEYLGFVEQAKAQGEEGTTSFDPEEKEVDYQLQEAWNILEDLIQMSEAREGLCQASEAA